MFSVCECHSQNLQRFYSWCMTHHIMSLQQPFPMCLCSSMIRTFAQQSRAHRFPDQIKIQKAMTFYYLSTDSAKTQVIVICSQKKTCLQMGQALFSRQLLSRQNLSGKIHGNTRFRTFADAMMSSRHSINRTATLVEIQMHFHNGIIRRGR